MTYGKLFKKYRQKFNVNNEFSSNKCSGLTRNELIMMAHNMYPEQKELLSRYMNKNTKDLAAAVHAALKTL